MSSQDDAREKAQKTLFGVKDYSSTGRGNTYTPDGKLFIGDKPYTIEFKSKPQTKGDVSTARGFKPSKAKEWKDQTDVFVFSEFEGKDFNGNFIEHYALTYDDLHPIIEEKVIRPFNEVRPPRKNSDGYYGMKEFERNVLPLLEEEDFSSADIKRIAHTMEVGTSLNDPKFRWKEIQKRGTQIHTPEDLRDFCLKNHLSA